MSQTPQSAATEAIQSSFPLPDIFSSTLTELFAQSRPAIVQVSNEQRGGGTGIVWQADGQIITNNHVVPEDGANIQVHFTDGRTLPAQVLHRNEPFDLALLKVDAAALPALPVGDSAKLRVGEWVFAIGHPWGQRWTVTAGIVSTLSTHQIEPDIHIPYIKSDVRLAPGNSGGPLLDADGHVVGVNAMIFGGDLSVSIPSNVVSNWLASLPKPQAILGIGIQSVKLPDSIQQQLSAPKSSGLLVVSVLEQEAPKPEIFIGDIILDIDNQTLNSTTTLRSQLAKKVPGDRVQLKIVRGGQVTSIQATLQSIETLG